MEISRSDVSPLRATITSCIFSFVPKLSLLLFLGVFLGGLVYSFIYFFNVLTDPPAAAPMGVSDDSDPASGPQQIRLAQPRTSTRLFIVLHFLLLLSSYIL